MKPTAFDAFAAGYDAALDDPWRNRFADDNAFFIRQKCRAMLADVEREEQRGFMGLRALDVGCGKGAAVQFVGRRWRTVGTDVSLNMIKGAPAGLPLAVQESFTVPFADDTFDVVFAFCVYHHIASHEHIRHLREMVRVTRRGGRIFIFEHNPLNPVTRQIFRRAPIDRGCAMIGAAHLRRLFREVGLSSVRTGYLLFFPQSWIRWLAGLERRLQWLPLGGQYFVTGRKLDEHAQ